MQMRERERRLPLCCPWNICSPFSLVFCFIYNYFFVCLLLIRQTGQSWNRFTHGQDDDVGQMAKQVAGFPRVPFSYRYHGQAGGRYFSFETKGEMGRSWNGW
jgi:hypothetical protein